MAEYKYRKSFVVGHKPDGTPIRKDIKENTKRAFDAKRRYYENLYQKGVNIVGRGMTVEQWAWAWYRTYKEPAVGNSQRQNYEINLRVHILPKIGHMDLKEVRPYHLQTLLNGCTSQVTGKPLAKSTLSKIKDTLEQIFERADIDGMIDGNPARRLIILSNIETSRRALTEAEETSLRKISKSHPAGLWVLLMLDCGLRRGETVPLQWQDIDFDNGLLNITKAVDMTSGHKPVVKSPKTKSGIRTIPVPPDLMARLEGVQGRPKELIFKNRDGGMMTLTKIRRTWNSIMRAWDIDLGAETYRNKIVKHVLDQSITPHYLRHTYSTNLRRKDVDLRLRMYLMGHSDEDTNNDYTHIAQSDVIKARQALFPEK